MKKMTALLLAAMLVLCLAACGGEPSAPETTAPVTTAPATTAPATTAPETTVPETTAPVEETVQMGVLEGNTYTNAFIGITVTLGDGWVYADEEQMAAIRGMTADAMNDQELIKLLESNGSVMDMYATEETGSTVNVMLEKLNLLQTVAVTEQSYVEAAVGQLPAALENMGFENVTVETTELIFAGESHGGIKVHGQIFGIDFYETMAVVKRGNYIACVTVASYGEDTTESVLALFRKIAL